MGGDWYVLTLTQVILMVSNLECHILQNFFLPSLITTYKLGYWEMEQFLSLETNGVYLLAEAN